MSTSDEEIQALVAAVESKREELADTKAAGQEAAIANNNDLYAEQLRAEAERLDREIAEEKRVQSFSSVSVGDVQSNADEATAAMEAAAAATPPPPPPADIKVPEAPVVKDAPEKKE